MEEYYEISTKSLPMIPLRGVWVFPQTVLHFDVGRELSLEALDESLKNDSEIFLTTQKDIYVEEPTSEDYYNTGTIATIKQTLKLPNGHTRVLVEGLHRAVIRNNSEDNSFLTIEVDEYRYQPEKLSMDDKMQAAIRLVFDDCSEYIALDKKLSPEMMLAVLDIEDPGRLTDIIAPYLNLKDEDNFDLLRTFDVYERLVKMHSILQKEIGLLKIEEKINRKVNKEINENQKQYYLREQLNVIRKELGEFSDDAPEDYVDKIKALKLPEDSEKHVLKEARRLETVSPGSAELNVIQNYLDHILDIPWNKRSNSNIDIKYARKTLEEGHYGLMDVKERILEFLAVQKLTDSLKGPILCFVGPPGVGKTSVAKSIAEATKREFVSMRLGGVRDEAEIRGHRKTYIGAMPGRIITLIEKAETMNPVFLLDEIDKLASDFRGDPASALLEVLDPAQNDEFTDNFIEIPVDLSDVLFITTANSTDTIPAALLDRMEIIDISSYTDEEKYKIAVQYLIPRQIKEHGLKDEQIHITRDAIKMIINNYTIEAGVRNLERTIGKLVRKAAVKIVEDDRKKIHVNVANLEQYLGKKRILDDRLIKEDTVGVCNGLAWTQVGGVILEIEANVMKGNGKIQLTGKLGDVMKESAMAAISYIRSNQQQLGIDKEFHKEEDIHIHVPEGAVPKDGPSAGITMTTALVSRLTGRKVRHDIAMTGEITLSGRVLPIGGVKEKVLAANRYDIHNIILPMENKKDIEDIPNNIKRKLNFKFVKNIDEVLQYALV
ncbi:MAG: endopeptidase La [Tissierellia bacterium]|nr:endopeptidase La [Tissierellia bacterium]